MARVDEFLQWIVDDHDLSKCRILDCGAGQGDTPYRHIIGERPEIAGIDLDPRVLENPLLDKSYVRSAYETRFPDNLFDVIFSIVVVEHLEKPVRFLAEMKRILKPAGSLYFVIPNMKHYFTLLAKSTPNGIAHIYYRLPWRKGRELDSVFPAYYRLNSARAIIGYSRKIGFADVEIRYSEREDAVRLYFPRCLRFIPEHYCRMINSHKSLEGMKISLMAKLTK